MREGHSAGGVERDIVKIPRDRSIVYYIPKGAKSKSQLPIFLYTYWSKKLLKAQTSHPVMSTSFLEIVRPSKTRSSRYPLAGDFDSSFGLALSCVSQKCFFFFFSKLTLITYKPSRVINCEPIRSCTYCIAQGKNPCSTLARALLLLSDALEKPRGEPPIDARVLRVERKPRIAACGIPTMYTL